MSFLFRMHVEGCEKGKGLAYVQYMDVTPPRENVDRALRCVSLRWSKGDDTDPTLAESDQCFGAQVVKAR